MGIKSVIVAIAFASVSGPATTDAEELTCIFDQFIGLRPGYTQEQRQEFYGIGFVANATQRYVRKLKEGKVGPKQTVSVKRTASFTSYILAVNGPVVRKINFRAYVDGRCYLLIQHPRYEDIWARGRIQR